MARHPKEPILVIGLGRFGSAVALELTRLGYEVLAVDSRPEIVQRFAGSLSRVVALDATDSDALREVGGADFTRAVVAIGDDQQSSILTTAVLTDLGVDDIWAKALDRRHGQILRRIGAHHVFQPEHEIGERVAHLLSGRMQDYIEIGKDWALVKTSPPQFLVGAPLGQSGLRSRHHVTVVSVRPEGEDEFTYADASTTPRYGDQILVVGKIRDVERFVDHI